MADNVVSTPDNDSINNYESLYGYQQEVAPVAGPLAETFTVHNDCYLTSIDLYFISKTVNSNDQLGHQGITMQIRNTDDNGKPGNTYYDEVTVSKDAVQVSQDGHTPTKFRFSNPVFLARNHHYALVLMTDSINYQLATAVGGHTTSGLDTDTDAIVPPRGAYGEGTMMYSTDGYTWNSLQYEDIKFTIYRAQFDQNDSVAFQTVYPANYNYQYDPTGFMDRDQPQISMDNMSYMTFRPVQWTPNNTQIKWYYTTSSNSATPNDKNWIPFNPYSSITVSGPISAINVKAELMGTQYVSPFIKENSLGIIAEHSRTDTKGADKSLGVGKNDFTNQDDSINAGEYVSRNMQMGNDPADAFNEVYASFEVQKPNGLGNCPASLYFNLNSTDDANNPFADRWVLLNGYDEIHDEAGGQGGTSKVTYTTINPDEPSDHQHQYTRAIDIGTNNWTKYDFHASLWNVYKNAFGGDGDANRKADYNPSSQGLPYADQIQFKIILHTNNSHQHPKVRRFMTSLNKEDEQED